ncbi:MAG: hypothetical protein AB1488_01200 [Nitrospirota bacterium]
MRWSYIFSMLGILSTFFGILFLFSPKTITKINERVNKLLLDLDKRTLAYRGGIGLSMLIAAVLFFFIAYYMRMKFGY